MSKQNYSNNLSNNRLCQFFLARHFFPTHRYVSPAAKSHENVKNHDCSPISNSMNIPNDHRSVSVDSLQARYIVSIDFAFERTARRYFIGFQSWRGFRSNGRINPNGKILKTDCCGIDLPVGAICVPVHSEHLVTLYFLPFVTCRVSCD